VVVVDGWKHPDRQAEEVERRGPQEEADEARAVLRVVVEADIAEAGLRTEDTTDKTVS
jgi:hypothetical protein